MNYVEPITDSRKIEAMSKYLKNKNRRDYIMFILGINVGLRISDMIDKKVGFFRRAAELGYVELAPKKQDKSEARQEERRKATSGKKVVQSWGIVNKGLENEEAVRVERGASGKRKVVRVYMSDEVIDVLKNEIYSREDEEYMFPSRNTGGGQKPITRQRAYDMLNEAAQAVGITDPIGTHSMRKTFGFWHYQRNHDVRMLMEIFGHSTEEITLKYIGITNQQKKESARGMNLGL